LTISQIDPHIKGCFGNKIHLKKVKKIQVAIFPVDLEVKISFTKLKNMAI